MSERAISAHLVVGDLAAAMLFYVDKLGFELVETKNTPPTEATLALGKTNIHLAMEGTNETTPSARIGVPRLDASIEELQQRNVSIIGPIEREPGGRELVVQDPDGNELTFFEQPDADQDENDE